MHSKYIHFSQKDSLSLEVSPLNMAIHKSGQKGNKVAKILSFSLEIFAIIVHTFSMSFSFINNPVV